MDLPSEWRGRWQLFASVLLWRQMRTGVKVINFRIITSRSMKNLAFHSLLRWNMIVLPILTTSLTHFLFKRLGELTFLNLGVKGLISREVPAYRRGVPSRKVPTHARCFLMEAALMGVALMGFALMGGGAYGWYPQTIVAPFGRYSKKGFANGWCPLRASAPYGECVWENRWRTAHEARTANYSRPSLPYPGFQRLLALGELGPAARISAPALRERVTSGTQGTPIPEITKKKTNGQKTPRATDRTAFVLVLPRWCPVPWGNPGWSYTRWPGLRPRWLRLGRWLRRSVHRMRCSQRWSRRTKWAPEDCQDKPKEKGEKERRKGREEER